MSQSQLKYSIFLILSVWCNVLVKSDIMTGKSSLTCVIDNTFSMTDDIDQVKDAAHQIFDTVMNSQKSQIDNFVLVTFNDPDIAPTQLRTITKDRAEFKDTLESIQVTEANYDCPEFCMTGIQLGLENSHFGSYLYVFTDASAKDYKIYENVKNLASEMQAQIVFVLTGECGSKHDEDYQVYHQLALATSGEVFHLEKQDVNVILNYVRYTIKEPPTYITSATFPPGYGYKFNYTLDSQFRDPLISVSGTEPKVDVTAPDGTKSQFEQLADLYEIVIITLIDTIPGTHIVEVGSKSNTSVKVVARSEIKFAFGFSNFIPTSFDDVTSRPVPDQKCHISVKLTEGLIDLHTLRILDLDGKQINEIPLIIQNDKEKIYATDLIEVPNTMFRIAIVGFDPKTKSNITRTASSPVEPQRITGKVITKSPTVTIGQETVVIEYNNPLKLTCKINGYPKPNVTWWIEKKPGVTLALPTNVSNFKLPYDYISILELEYVKDNATYKCEATNIEGTNAKETVVQVNNFLKVLEEPKDATIQYNKEGNIHCKINSYPNAKITWYKIGIKDTLTNNSNINIVTNNSSSVLRIKSMDIENVGTYICEARNGIKSKLLKAQIDIDGVEPPVIDKKENELHIKLNEDSNVTCSILKGVPNPTIRWYFKKDNSSKSIEMPTWLNRQAVYIRNAQKNNQGIYVCLAENVLGKDDKEVYVFVEYPPHIKDDRKYIQVKESQNVFLPCQVEGNPSPSVEWYKNDKPYIKKDKDYLYENNTLRINSISVVDSAKYTCLAANHLGVTNKTIYVKVLVPVYITTPRDKIFNATVGSRFELSCEATGDPTPKILWTWKVNDKGISQTIKSEVTHESTLLFKRIQLKDDGIYNCNAWNSRLSTDVASYTVRVLAPPVIENVYPEKVFKPVEGDLVLRINCLASGNPKPTINWIRDGYYVALGDSYNVEDGTLIIKDIDKADSGTYVCEAENSLGRSTESYEVEVLSAPPIKNKSRTVLVPFGETAHINCDIPRKRTDRLRWFKNGKFLKNGELALYQAKPTDTGHYFCRVNYKNKSATDVIEVIVGFKPVFITNKPEGVEMVSGNTIFLNCEAVGVPVPKVQWWHNKVKINSSNFIYTVEPTLKNEGLYYCKVANYFGSIVRKFNVRSKDCLINFRKQTSKQPLIFSSTTTIKSLQTSWHMFYINEEDSMIIPRHGYVNLFCPSRFTKFPFPYVTAFCDSGSNFKVMGKSMEFSQIQCTEQNHHIVRPTGEYCLPNSVYAKKLKISFRVSRDMIDVYEVCFDTHAQSPIYTKVHMAKHSIYAVEEPKLSDKKYFSMDFDEMYDCKRQSKVIETILKKQWHEDDGCCFRKRQLVNIKDVFPGAPQEAISSYLNIVPQWGTCNSENWDELERSVQALSKLSYSDILVWTGVSGHLDLPTASGKNGRIRIVDKTGHQQPVPKYLWKVIQNPSTSSSVAVIQMNIPDLNHHSKVYKHILCHDVCKSIKWMNGTNWNDVNKGYIYCCYLDEFTNAFNLKGVFEPHYNLLRNAE